MRRRRGGPAPAEPCGVWLDTAELKRGPARPPSARLRAPVRKQSPALLPQPGRRQSTIPTFFRPRSGEGDKENSRPAPCEGSGVPVPAWPVKILPLPQLEGAREEPPRAEEGVQRCWKTPLGALELQVQPQKQSKASCGAGGDSWCYSCSQSPEKSWLFPGETASAGREAQPWSRAGAEDTKAGSGAEDSNPGPGAEDSNPRPGAEDTNPGPGAEDTKAGSRAEDTDPGPGTEDTNPGSRAEDTDPGPGAEDTDPGSRAEDTDPGPGAEDTDPVSGAGHTNPGSGAEDTNPGPGAEDTDPGPGAAPRGVCCSPQSPVRAQPLRERGQLPAGSCRLLFSQDSQGNRVIAHRARASPPRASQPRGLWLEPGWEPLFTQDSEGNRVIKHWE